MKRKLLSVLVAAALSLSCFSAVPINSKAATYTSGDFTYKFGNIIFDTYFSVGEGCEITGYNGSEKSIVIPSEFDGKPVIAIGDDVFSGNEEVSSVSIPDTVQSIGQNAFNNCSSLTSIDLGDSIKYLGDSCFNNCNLLTSIDIPASLTASDARVGAPFSDYSYPSSCYSLRTATIEGGGECIPNSLFYGCIALEKVNIPKGIKTIGSFAFGNCESLKEVKIPDSVLDIYSQAFVDCTSLKNVKLGNSVRSLGYGCFRGCDSLNSITIPASLTMPDVKAFDSFTGDSIKTVNIEGGGTIIPYALFNGCTGLEKINIPEGIQEIYSSAFMGCSSLKEIELPNSIHEIDSLAFSECISLEKISLPESIGIIEEEAFSGCSSLEVFYDYNKKTEYGEDVFRDGTNITMHGYEDSNAEKYANDNNITFVPLSKKEIDERKKEIVKYGNQMYRLYNKNSGEHFYTSSAVEKNNLVSDGWANEGEAWIAPASSNTPVYRLYNPNSGEHHYTMKSSEKDFLVGVGWNDEGIGWYSDDNQGTPLYRLYNPNATGDKEAGGHHYTKDVNEKNNLTAAGWKDEGIGWYGI